jgi:hypothetical protein
MKRGRPYKFEIGEVVSTNLDRWAVVDRRPGEYRLVRLDARFYPYGPALWFSSWKLHGILGIGGASQQAPRNYRANSKLTDRGCDCQCCPHVRIPPSEVKEWENGGTSQS